MSGLPLRSLHETYEMIFRGSMPKIISENADKHFAVLAKLGLQVKPGLIVCSGGELLPYSRNAWYCPAALL